MRAREAAARVDEILDGDLRQLTEHGTLSVLPSEIIEHWGLPEADMHMLESYGLPPARQDGLLGITAAFQESADPLLEGGLFEIGTYGVTKLGLNVADGWVRAVSSYTVAEIHPQLRALHSDKERVQAVNSTLAAFVNFSWRWYWILPVLAQQQIMAGDEEVQAWSTARTDVERSGLPDFYSDVRSLCEKVLRSFETADPQMPHGEAAFWRTVVMENL